MPEFPSAPRDSHGSWTGGGTGADRSAPDCSTRSASSSARASFPPGRAFPPSGRSRSRWEWRGPRVTHAFDALRTEGQLVSRTGVGTFVSAAGRHVTARGDDRLSSFADERDDTRIDLRSAALPGIPLVGDVLAGRDAEDFSEIIATPGYVPAVLPIPLRRIFSIGLPLASSSISLSR